MNSKELYLQYQTKMQQIADVKYATAVLQWDQETYLPPKGSVIRGRQIATLSEMAHRLFTDDQVGGLLQKLQDSNDLSGKEKINVQRSTEDYEKNKKLKSDFVRRLAETVNTCFHAWIKARKDNSFSVFEKPLDELIELKKQEADLLGYRDHPYNALMNDYDKGLTVTETDKLFADLRPQLSALLDKIKNTQQVNNEFLHLHFDKGKQWQFGLKILALIHFDFEAGRQDISEHPFTINFSSSDVRLTTRIDENDFGNMTWSCLHEGGHALYEQGLPSDQYGMPLGEYCSLSIHESQSRLWENCVGRGMAFWQKNYTLIAEYFPDQFKDIGLQDFYRGINKVQPSLIRTEADELTYHFHVMIRYEIEKQLIEGSLKTKDIPATWNELYFKYLGIKVPDDKNGCLQDVHWSHGSFGYFATYSLGSLYASQFYESCSRYLNIEKDLALGNNKNLLQWLRTNIHGYGRHYTSAELCKNATGEPLNSSYFINYANKKYQSIYNIPT